MFTPEALDSVEPARLSESVVLVVIDDPSTAMFCAEAEPIVVGPM
jgi:hypothetical protein